MDTNVVLPFNGSSTDRCRVVFDYWLDAAAVQRAAATVQGDNEAPASANPSSSSSSSSSSSCTSAVVEAAHSSAFVQDSLASSHKVQEEDTALCEAVQLGLAEPAYGVGRYAPGPEAPMYHFHSLLYDSVMHGMKEQR
ncbi:hypothetical protein COO60DRAFT_561317 [Scenedesmus sp. NREL 46B-D3]|nr:hypothetical protein COO60DRAFT_561317 [Scenedesmus sp. NREL 46B-D3]